MTQSPTTMSKSITFTSSLSTKPTQSIYSRPQKRPKMSITQTYYLAHSARGKLSKEAARPDHDLRLLVGHANMLDSLMLDLANAEQEQERWFNKSLTESEEEEEEEADTDQVETILEETTTSYYDSNGASIVSPVEAESFEQEGFYLPSRQEPIQIAAY
ncbi:hypothetical protein DV735_g543, partial [Chaetothyriales sp. CBS 134920]